MSSWAICVHVHRGVVGAERIRISVLVVVVVVVVTEIGLNVVTDTIIP